jgi:excisionase family DNA binding protein
LTVSRTTPASELPELMRADEVASWLGCSRGLVFEMARRGDLPSVRLGRLLRIPRAGLAALAGRNGADDAE